MPLTGGAPLPEGFSRRIAPVRGQDSVTHPDRLPRFFVFPPFTVDTVNRTLLRNSRAVPLGSRAFDTLVTLIRHRDRVVEKEDFLREAWRGVLVEESNLTKQVSLLRKVLEDTPGSHRYIVTVPGTGYRFGAQVEEREAVQEPLPADPANLREPPRRVGIRSAVFAAVGAVLLGAIIGKVTVGSGVPASGSSPSLLWQLTFDKGVQTDPAWSPDGLRIAYSSDRSGYEDIWLKPVDGGPAVPLTQSPSPDVEPDWSPDGKWLVFATLGAGGGIRVMSSTGGAVQEIAPFGTSPKWSPDGSSILFTRSDWGPAQLYRLGPRRHSPSTCSRRVSGPVHHASICVASRLAACLGVGRASRHRARLLDGRSGWDRCRAIGHRSRVCWRSSNAAP